MKAECKRCGYTWNTRSTDPKRCPQCKTIRWDKSKVKNICTRCGASWAQRGDSVPKYCPVCHSTMWNVKKKTYTCPKCGQSRVIKSNSRLGKCPFCDSYNDNTDREYSETQVKSYGISPMIHLWSNGKGLTLNASDKFGTAYLYDNGTLVTSVNLVYWFKTFGVSLTENTDLQNEKMQKILSEIVYKNLTKTESDKDLGDSVASIHHCYESGMNPVLISLKLRIPFNHVMNILNNATE